jgi:hypothetical protein
MHGWTGWALRDTARMLARARGVSVILGAATFCHRQQNRHAGHWPT